MTDLEVMQRAKKYMDRLAQGIDPITGNEMPEDSLLNNVRLARCFFYVSGILQQVIDNGGTVGNKQQKKNSFVVTPQLAARLAPADRSLHISDFTEMLAAAADDPNIKRPRTTVITDWLLAKGFLEKIPNVEGKQQRVLCRRRHGLRILDDVEFAVPVVRCDVQFLLDGTDLFHTDRGAILPTDKANVRGNIGENFVALAAFSAGKITVARGAGDSSTDLPCRRMFTAADRAGEYICVRCFTGLNIGADSVFQFMIAEQSGENFCHIPRSCVLKCTF